MKQRGIFLPGYACTSAIWQDLDEELAAAYELTRVDWPVAQTPGFHEVADFRRWLAESISHQHFDFVIGHSLGGLVGLDLAASGQATFARIILIETFVLPPAPLFHNLVLKEQTAHGRATASMLEQEREHYSPALAKRLAMVDMQAEISRLRQPLFALYGDRGSASRAEVIRALAWPEGLAERIEVAVIANACHFPMLENPRATVQAVTRFLDP